MPETRKDFLKNLQADSAEANAVLDRVIEDLTASGALETQVVEFDGKKTEVISTAKWRPTL